MFDHTDADQNAYDAVVEAWEETKSQPDTPSFNQIGSGLNVNTGSRGSEVPRKQQNSRKKKYKVIIV